jgi:hypothetical protein
MKNFLLTVSLIAIASFLHAQYLVSATEIATRTATTVNIILTNEGWQTSQMELNGVTSYKITYNTTDVFGEPTVASGALYVPQVDCDTLPFISYQHGTTFDDANVPSNNYVYQFGILYSGNGYITTMPDYLGLGDNPGIHPYVHWESEASASVDLIRAAREYIVDTLGIWDNNQLFLAGYSQGGHATMALHKYITVNDLQEEFNIVASAPMSGPFPLSDIQLPMMFEGETYPAPAYLPYVMASYQLVYGNLYENYNEYYDPPYDSLIASWLEDGATFDPYGDLPTNFYDFMQDTVVDNIKSNPDHPFNLGIIENNLHNWIPGEPVRMLYCGMDPLVYPENSIVTQDTMTTLGASDVQAIEIDPYGDHQTCIVPAFAYSLEWFDSLRVECEMVITAIPSRDEQPEISLYPNPVTKKATFSSDEITSVELYDITGKIIARRNGNTIDMTNLKPGIYFVNGYDTHQNVLYTGKVIKK